MFGDDDTVAWGKHKLEKKCCYGLHKIIETRNAIATTTDKKKYRSQMYPAWMSIN